MASFNNCLHPYIIGHYYPSVSIIDLVSHSTYVVCVNFRLECWNLQFRVDSEKQFYLLSEFFCQKSTERISQKTSICNLFWCLAWGSNPDFTSNKSTHYTALIRTTKWSNWPIALKRLWLRFYSFSELLSGDCCKEFAKKIFFHISFFRDFWAKVWIMDSTLITQHSTY